ncbi:hypothetical protein EPUL_001824 [Erysiphe pulchra]|uniref:Uncharacterized protein n=1 Tax=Erysiphe pulchra TaxID=225359 RepID=A0A2S4PSV8_9PEZI|nr:hypothetical protein EPUL_001824 [Erysiphe pulchra]
MPMNECLMQDISHDGSSITETHNQPGNHEQKGSWTPERSAFNSFSPKKVQTLDLRLAQVDAFRNAKQKLQDTLHLIQEKFTPPNSECNSGHPDYRNCDAKNRKIIDAYKDYFLSSDPNSWYTNILGYETEMQARFRDIKTPTKQDLKDLYFIFHTKLREYIFTVINDLKLDGDIELSNIISNNIPKDIPLEILVQKAYDTLLSLLPNSNAKQLILSLQNTKTAGERAPLYIQYYCPIAEDDTPQQRNFKTKYARMFENRLNHDEVLTAMQKEAQDLYSQRVSALHTELGELQLAQSAHLKKKVRKAENFQQVRDRKSNQMSICCSLVHCRAEIDLTKENIECALCEWLERKGSGKGRFFYCSSEHAEEDFVR